MKGQVCRDGQPLAAAGSMSSLGSVRLAAPASQSQSFELTSLDGIVVEIDLRQASMRHGKKGFERLVWAAKKVLNRSLTWMFYDMSQSKPGAAKGGESQKVPHELYVAISDYLRR